MFGRSQLAISSFGANIYPENVAVGLEQSPICDWVTGKFVMEIREIGNRNSQLAIAVELAPNQTGDLDKINAIAASISYHLQRLSSEFANYVPESDRIPHIELKATGDPEYFPIGVKHRYRKAGGKPPTSGVWMNAVAALAA